MAALPQALRAELRQFVLLGVRLEMFDRVWFRSIDEKKLQAPLLFASDWPGDCDGSGPSRTTNSSLLILLAAAALFHRQIKSLLKRTGLCQFSSPVWWIRPQGRRYGLIQPGVYLLAD